MRHPETLGLAAGKSWLYYLLLVLGLTGCGGARTFHLHQSTSEAEQAFVAGEYEESARMYARLARSTVSAPLWRRSADAYIRLSQLKNAEQSLLEAIRLGDRSQELHGFLVSIFGKIGQTLKKSKSGSSERKLFDPVEYWSERGRAQLRARQFGPAARDLAIATDIDPKRVADWMALGDARRGTRETLLAARAYTEAFLRLKQYAEQDTLARKRRRRMFSLVIRLAAETKAYDLAASVIGDLVSDWPENLISRFLSRSMPSELQPALPLAYGKILAKRPEFMSIRIALIKHHYRENGWLEVCRLVEPMVSRLVYLPKILEIASDAAFRAKRTALALYILGQNREARPRRLENTIKLVRGLFRARHFARARSELFLARHGHPDDPRIAYLYASSLHETGDSAAALNLMRKSIVDHRNHAPSLNYVGYELARQNKNLEEAEVMIRLALRVEPENPSYLDSLAWVYYRTGRFSKAYDILKKVVVLVPDNGEILFHLACVLRRKNMDKTAEFYFRRAMDLELSLERRNEYEDEWKRIKTD